MRRACPANALHFWRNRMCMQRTDRDRRFASKIIGDGGLRLASRTAKRKGDRKST